MDGFEDAAAEVGTEAEDSFGARAITRFLAAKYTAVVVVTGILLYSRIYCALLFYCVWFSPQCIELRLLRLCARLCMCVSWMVVVKAYYYRKLEAVQIWLRSC